MVIVEPWLSVTPVGNGSSPAAGGAEGVNGRLPWPVTGSTVLEPTLVLLIVPGRSTGVVPSVGTFSTVIVSVWTTTPFSTAYWKVAVALSPEAPVIEAVRF